MQGTEKGNLAIITVDPRGTATVRRAATGATVLVNGVALGAEPAPLLHGDRIEVAGRQLRFSDDRKAGSTVLMPAFSAPAAKPAVPGRGRSGVSGGRLVSLVDGRENVVSSYADEAFAPAPVAAEAASPPLAVLEVINEGTTKGTHLAVRSPLAHVGRGGHNDVVITDDSVSDSHAKLQRRESGWFVVDTDSTNGTYVAGQRVRGEQALANNVALRVGGVKLVFRPESESAAACSESGTRVIVGLNPPHPRRVSGARPIVPAREATMEPKTSPRGVPAVAWLAAAALIGATVLLVIQDR